MNQELHADPTDRFDTSGILVSGYDELTRVDQALRDAEQRLRAAHILRTEHGPRRAQELYQEVIALRDRSRLVLAVLGEIWVAEC
jgi:hypothetical protein